MTPNLILIERLLKSLPHQLSLNRNLLEISINTRISILMKRRKEMMIIIIITKVVPMVERVVMLDTVMII